MFGITSLLLGMHFAPGLGRAQPVSDNGPLDPEGNAVVASMTMMSFNALVVILHIENVARTRFETTINPWVLFSILLVVVAGNFIGGCLIADQERRWLKNLAILVPWLVLLMMFVTHRFSLFGIW